MISRTQTIISSLKKIFISKPYSLGDGISNTPKHRKILNLCILTMTIVETKCVVHPKKI